jgi:pyruvate formate lyase activating enzyme
VKATNRETTGWVFNIQHYSIHDGPGIRTTVFLKGCPLRCLWCSNPESQRLKPQILFDNDRCIRCDACITTCPNDAILVNEDGTRQIQAENCNLCGLCIEGCYAGALEQIGKEMTVGDVLAEIKTDQPFYDQSGGGITLSGGEPALQSRFSLGLLQGSKALGIHTAIETTGYVKWDVWESLRPYLDLVLYDLKELDSELHTRWTGLPNELVLDNLKRLANSGVAVIVRRPVIPDYNDSVESIHQLGRFVRDLGIIEEIDLLPYHRFGKGKYERLGLEYAMGDTPSMKAEEVTELYNILHSYGLNVKIGG